MRERSGLFWQQRLINYQAEMSTQSGNLPDLGDWLGGYEKSGLAVRIANPLNV